MRRPFSLAFAASTLALSACTVGPDYRRPDLPTAPKGATGYGVRLLDRLVADHFEG